jgi:hypothetical protein
LFTQSYLAFPTQSAQEIRWRTIKTGFPPASQ